MERMSFGDCLVLNAPDGYGKTSLLCHFLQRSQYEVKLCDMTNSTPSLVSPHSILASVGIHVSNNGVIWPQVTRKTVVIVENAHQATNCQGLLSEVSSSVPANIALIISTNHSMPELADCADITSEEFLFSLEESLDLLLMPAPVGLSSKIVFQTVLKCLAIECGGVPSLLRRTITWLNDQFRDQMHVTLDDVLVSIFSRRMTNVWSDVFNRQVGDISPTSSLFVTALLETRVTCGAELSGLVEGGLLVRRAADMVKFASPAAARYLSMRLFPHRPAVSIPASILEFVVQSIKLMSAAELRGAGGPHINPNVKEGALQHLLMHAMHQRLPIGYYYLCPELSSVFAEHPSRAVTTCTEIKGEIDFYLDYVLRWGIEILVRGRKLGSHIARFTGKYAPLNLKKHIVVDFRFSDDPVSTTTDPNLLSIRFSADFTTFRMRYGDGPWTEETTAP